MSSEGGSRLPSAPAASLAICAKRKGGEVIENKQSRESGDFAPPKDFNGLRPLRETLHFALRNGFFCFCRVFRLVEGPRRNGAKSTAASELARRKLRVSGPAA
jgi:hypothetical protein